MGSAGLNSVAVGDFDQDTDLDVVFAGLNYVRWMENADGAATEWIFHILLNHHGLPHLHLDLVDGAAGGIVDFDPVVVLALRILVGGVVRGHEFVDGQLRRNRGAGAENDRKNQQASDARPSDARKHRRSWHKKIPTSL